MATRRDRATLIVAVLALGALAVAACGGDSGDNSATTGTRTVDIEMRDISYSPNTVDVKAGETVRFVFHNKGKIRHDAFLGDEAAQAAHEMEMRQGESSTTMKMDGSSTSMEMGAGTTAMERGDMTSSGGITVEPGRTGELTHTFEAGDELLIGCHEAGHYAAGMKITVNVS